MYTNKQLFKSSIVILSIRYQLICVVVIYDAPVKHCAAVHEYIIASFAIVMAYDRI